MNLKQLFEYQTVRELGEAIDAATESDSGQATGAHKDSRQTRSASRTSDPSSDGRRHPLKQPVMWSGLRFWSRWTDFGHTGSKHWKKLDWCRKERQLSPKCSLKPAYAANRRTIWLPFHVMPDGLPPA